jgi:hypothetical protein
MESENPGSSCDGNQILNSNELENEIKRKGSWKRFRDTLKGWVFGDKGNEDFRHLDPAVPSAVFPSDEVTHSVINVKDILHGTNSYSESPKYVSHFPTEVPEIVVTDSSPAKPRRLSWPAKSSIRRHNAPGETFVTALENDMKLHILHSINTIQASLNIKHISCERSFFRYVL